MKPNKRVILMAVVVVIVLLFVLCFVSWTRIATGIYAFNNVSDEKAASFQRTIKRLSRGNVVSIEELIGMIKGGKQIPPCTAAVSVEDASVDNFKNAFSVLRKYNVPATVFIVVDKVGTTGYADWDQIREMSKAGMSIGSRTKSGEGNLGSLSWSKLRQEIAYSKIILENEIQKPVVLFSYPDGKYEEKIVGELKRAGYIGACTREKGSISAKTDVYRLKRL